MHLIITLIVFIACIKLSLSWGAFINNNELNELCRQIQYSYHYIDATFVTWMK